MTTITVCALEEIEDGVARGFDRHGHHIFVQTGHRFLFDRRASPAAAPHAVDFGGGQPETGHIRAVAHDAHIVVRF